MTLSIAQTHMSVSGLLLTANIGSPYALLIGAKFDDLMWPWTHVTRLSRNFSWHFCQLLQLTALSTTEIGVHSLQQKSIVY